MSRQTLFILGTVLMCTGILLFSGAPKLDINTLNDFFVLIPHQIVTNPVATACIIGGAVSFYKATKSK